MDKSWQVSVSFHILAIISALYTLTGVVSGVASIAASGGEVPLLLLLGVGGADRCSCDAFGNGGLCGGTVMLGDQNVSSSPLLISVVVNPPQIFIGVQVKD